MQIIEAFERDPEFSKETTLVDNFDKLKFSKDFKEEVLKELNHFRENGFFTQGEYHLHLIKMNSKYVLRQGFDDEFVCNNATNELFSAVTNNMGLEAACLVVNNFMEEYTLSIENVKEGLICYEPIDYHRIDALKIYFHRTHDDAVLPSIAYGGTSAAFDLTVVEDTIINPGESKFVEHGLNLTIDQNEPYYMQFFCRSSAGIKKNLRCHPGIIDAGYTGPFAAYVHNLGKEPVEIKKGDRIVQVVVHKKHNFRFVELDDKEFAELEEKQQRGNQGFGSSGK